MDIIFFGMFFSFLHPPLLDNRRFDVRTVDESGNLGAAEEEDEIPDMEDIEDDEEAIIRDPQGDSNTKA